MKKYSERDIYILVSIMVAIFAFLNTSNAIWTITFLRQFLLNIIEYGIASVFAYWVWASWLYYRNKREEKGKKDIEDLLKD